MENISSRAEGVPSIDPEENGGLEALLSPSGAFFSFSLRPLLMGSYAGRKKSGCVVEVSPTENHAKSELFERMRDALQSATKSPPKSLLGAVQNLLLHQEDDILQIRKAVKLFSDSLEPMAGQDEVGWFARPCSPLLRSSAFLRRLAMPMHVLENGSELAELEFSFLDLILQLEGLNILAGSCILSRIDTLEKEATNPGRSPKEIKMIRQLQKLLIQTISRAGIRDKVEPLSSKAAASDKVLHLRGSFFVPPSKSENLLAVRAERQRLLQELEERKMNEGADIHHYAVGGKIKLPYRIQNGCLLITEQELSHEEFCKQMKVTGKVNQTLPRPFHRGVSRPKLQKVDLSISTLSQLRSIFFDTDGSLRNTMMDDIDLSSRHGYINFSNASCRDQRNDYRWQVPVKRHTMRGFVSTRSAVESFFSEQKILSPGHETIHDMGILIGGTEDQSIHHDIPRQTTSWLPEDPEISGKPGVPVSGWEFDRAAYNEAMASPHAPSSVLLGMSDSGEANLGVQKNQIERLGYVPSRG
jgi:hypothetical protein